MSPVLEVRDLHVEFDIESGHLHAVRGVSLALHARDRLGIVGESGCGKSTLVLAMMGLLPPNAEVSGQVLFDGIDILAGGDSGMRPHRWRDIAMVFQGAMNAFNPVRTIGEQIAEPIRIHRKASRRDANDRVGELLEMVGIPARRAAHYPHEFSGGMRQRVGLARALAVNAKVLLMDEPFSAVDEQTRRKFQEDMLSLVKNEQKTFIFVTHSIEEAVYVSDRIVLLHRRPSRVSEIIEPQIGRNVDPEMIRRQPEYLDAVENIWQSLKKFLD